MAISLAEVHLWSNYVGVRGSKQLPNELHPCSEHSSGINEWGGNQQREFSACFCYQQAKIKFVDPSRRRC